MEDLKLFEAINKIELTDLERGLVNEQIDNLFSSFDSLSLIDTTDTIPLVSVIDVSNVMREDIVSQSVSRETLLLNAHTTNEEYFEIPRIL